MEEKRKKKLVMYAYGVFVSAGVTALFWSIWYFAVGLVPSVSQIRFSETITWQLPFPVSRCWDVFIVPIWAILFIWVFTRRWKSLVFAVYPKTHLGTGLAIGLIYGALFGLPAALHYNNLIFGLFFGLGVNLILFSLIFGPAFGIASGLSYYLVLCLPLGLLFGLGLSICCVIPIYFLSSYLLPWNRGLAQDFIDKYNRIMSPTG